MIVKLSPEWEARAAEAGRKRAEYQWKEKIPEFGGRCIDYELSVAQHVAGCRTECAVAKVCRLPWDPSVGVLGGVDVGGKVEVRARRLSYPYDGEPGYRGTDIGYRGSDADKVQYPFVLAYVFADDGTIDLIGWLWGHEMRDSGGPWNLGVLYVPPPYRSVDSLVALFAKVTA